MKKNIYKNTLCLLLIFHMLNYLSWFKLGVWPFGKDWFLHLANIHRLSLRLDAKISLDNIFFVDIAYPPFYYWIGLILKWICLGVNRAIFLIAPLFFIVLILSVYGIGKELKNKKLGLIAATICSFYPAIYSKINQIDLDLANAAMVSLVIYILLKTKNFGKTIYSILFGIIFAFGLLTREFFWIFTLGPIFFSLRDNLTILRTRQRSRNIAIAIILILSISGIFYLNPRVYLSAFERSFYIGEVMDKNIFSWQQLLFYFNTLPSQLGLISTIFFLCGIYHLTKTNYWFKSLLISWIAIPLICFTFVVLKFSQYTIAYLPASAFIIALGIDNIKDKKLEHLILGGFFIISMSLYFYNFH